MNDTEGTRLSSEGTSPFRFPDGSLKLIAGGAEDDEEEDEDTDEEDEETTDDNNEDDDEEEDDELAEAVNKRLAAEKAKWEEEGKREYERLRDEDSKRDKAKKDREDHETKLKTAFGDTVKDIRTKIKSFKIRAEDGQIMDVNLSDEFLEENLFKPLNVYNQSGLEAAGLQIKQELAHSALESLPDKAREEFEKNAEDKEWDEWLKLYGESYAPESSWYKAFKKQHDLELEAVKEAEYLRGFKKGQKSPAGSAPPSAKSKGGKKESVDKTTITGITKAKAAGLIDDKEFVTLWKKITNKF